MYHDSLDPQISSLLLLSAFGLFVFSEVNYISSSRIFTCLHQCPASATMDSDIASISAAMAKVGKLFAECVSSSGLSS